MTFIDYQKAYDRVNRQKLIQYLDSRGCGNVFLRALQHSMTSSAVIENDIFSTSSGVKQGGSTSCNSFTAYIDPTIDAVKSCGPDSWLDDIHILLLMDDTVILASSREKMTNKLQKLKYAVDDIGMVLHPTKCQFLTVNSNDTVPFVLDNATISQTESYTYLGAHISNDTVTNQVKKHITCKSSHLRKFTSFLTRNSECPYSVKRRVWNSALNAATLYSCETWLTTNLRAAETPYNTSLKQMLGVRSTTCNDLVYIETGLPDVKSVIIDRQVKFLVKLRRHNPDSYIMKIVNMAKNVRSPMGLQIQNLVNQATLATNSTRFMTTVKTGVLQSQSSRRITYRQINPKLEVNPMLQVTGATAISEQGRIASTRLRLSSHYLRVETGRWSRIPLEDRLCQCQTGIQTEEHVWLRCPLSQTLRQQLKIQCNYVHELFNVNCMNLSVTAEYCHLILNLYRT